MEEALLRDISLASAPEAARVIMVWHCNVMGNYASETGT